MKVWCEECVPYAMGCGLVVGARNCVCEVVQVFGEVRVCRGRDAARAECGKTLLARVDVTCFYHVDDDLVLFVFFCEEKKAKNIKI